MVSTPVSLFLNSPVFFFSDNIPEELKDPFYIDQYEQEHIKPPVIKLLLSSELYYRVCSLILKGDQVAALQGHHSVIQALSRKGIYVMESDDNPVSESDLSSAPIKMVSFETKPGVELHNSVLSLSLFPFIDFPPSSPPEMVPVLNWPTTFLNLLEKGIKSNMGVFFSWPCRVLTWP